MNSCSWIDRLAGRVVYDDAVKRAASTISLITFATAACVLLAADTDVPTLPKDRGGQDVIGKRMPAVKFDRWWNTDDNKPLDINGRVTLYRWWTDSCPYCEASLPAVAKLREKYAKRGLRTIAVYHPKPPRKVDAGAIVGRAKTWKYTGPIAEDRDWSELTKFYLSTGRRRATSVSFLVDQRGVIRFVHPGTEFYPSDDPDHNQQNADYQLIDRAIDALLREAEN